MKDVLDLIAVAGQTSPVPQIDLSDTGTQIIVMVLCLLALAGFAIRDAVVRYWRRNKNGNLVTFVSFILRRAGAAFKGLVANRHARPSWNSANHFHGAMPTPPAEPEAVPTRRSRAPINPRVVLNLPAAPATAAPPTAVAAPAAPRFPWTQTAPWVTVKGTEKALANPPSDPLEVIAYMRAEHQRIYKEPGRFLVPHGFTIENGQPHCWWTRLVKGVNHYGVAGSSESGKDSRMQYQTICLMLQHPPEEFSLWVIDGKGDWVLFEDKAHTRMCALDPEDIEDAFIALEEERTRRQRIIRDYSKKHNIRAHWGMLPEEFRRAHDMPLMWVVVTEIDLLMACFKTQVAFDRALGTQLRASRSSGGRWCISNQKFNGAQTNWRSQVLHWASGAQLFDSDDEPNTSRTTAQIRAEKALPPSDMTLPLHAGVMTICSGRNAVTVRDSYLDEVQFGQWLAKLPDRVMPVRQRTEDTRQEEKPADRPTLPAPPAQPLQRAGTPPISYAGPEMSLEEIAAYISRCPNTPMWRIQDQLFGNTDKDEAYRIVTKAKLLLKEATMADASTVFDE